MCWSAGLNPGRLTIHSDEIGNRPMSFNRMTERQASINLVTVLASDLLTLDDPRGFEINDDSLHGPLRDPNFAGQLAEEELRVAGQQDQDVCMIRQKRPFGAVGHVRLRDLTSPHSPGSARDLRRFGLVLHHWCR